MYTNFRGFTLIELMIVIAIIGILASIAIPAYRHYVIKSRYSEVILSTAAVKTAIDICAQAEGGLSNCGSDPTDNPGPKVAAANAAGGSYVNTVTINASGSQITATPLVKGGIVALDTYILTAQFNAGAVTWTLDTNSGCYSKGYC